MVRRQASGNRAFGLILLLALAGGVVASGCGSGGGGGHDGIDGGVCAQCGETDGPCRDMVDVTGSDAQELCNADSCTGVKLACFRKLGSSQRRCYPNNGDLASQQFRCDGERANRNTPTPTPTVTLSVTPTLTEAASPTISPTFTPGGGEATVTPTATVPATTTPTSPTPAVSPTPVGDCGNGEVDPDEECDGTNLDEQDCTDLCDADSTGTLRCTSGCTFDTSGCTGDCS